MSTTALSKRYTLIDILRGLSVLAMIAYHTIWDLVNIYGVPVVGFTDDSLARFIIQRSIRWSFILLSGFCFQMGRHKLKRGLMVFGSGALITLVTMIAMPNAPIHIGVLTFIGSAMLLSILPDKLFRHIPGWLGLPICIYLFLATEFVPERLLGRGTFAVELPWQLYNNYFTAWLGMPDPLFYSSDYVPVIPWLFVFWIGYFAYSTFKKYDWLNVLSCIRFAPLEWIGKHALIIYLIHQPIIYGALYILFGLLKS